MNGRNIFSLSAFPAFVLALAATNAGPAGAVTDVSDSEWTVVTMDFDGSWGVGTATSTNLAILRALANCKMMSKKEIGCGAYSKTMRFGWILALRCGSESVLEADLKLEEVKKLAIARESELRQLYVRDMPPCRLVFSVDPRGVVIREIF